MINEERQMIKETIRGRCGVGYILFGLWCPGGASVLGATSSFACLKTGLDGDDRVGEGRGTHSKDVEKLSERKLLTGAENLQIGQNIKYTNYG